MKKKKTKKKEKKNFGKMFLFPHLSVAQV